MKEIRKGGLRLLSIAIPTACIVLTVVLLTTANVRHARRPRRDKPSSGGAHNNNNIPIFVSSYHSDDAILPLEYASSTAVAVNATASSSSSPSQLEEDHDLFTNGGKTTTTTTVETYQTANECLLSGNLCEAFSADCCAGLVCVPVNVSESRCSNARGNICINIGKICSDAVIGVECCDNAVCTPEEGGTGRSRCVL